MLPCRWGYSNPCIPTRPPIPVSYTHLEIQTTFAALGTNEAEEGAKEYIRGCVIESICKSCVNYRTCMIHGLENGLNKLIDIGCAKGKTSLIDIPTDLAESCINQSGVLYAVNRQIGDYRKYMLETENAASGRQLLANQAQGVSAVSYTHLRGNFHPFIRVAGHEVRAGNIHFSGRALPEDVYKRQAWACLYRKRR